jgi:hypothetical protein
MNYFISTLAIVALVNCSNPPPMPTPAALGSTPQDDDFSSSRPTDCLKPSNPSSDDKKEDDSSDGISDIFSLQDDPFKDSEPSDSSDSPDTSDPSSSASSSPADCPKPPDTSSAADQNPKDQGDLESFKSPPKMLECNKDGKYYDRLKEQGKPESEQKCSSYALATDWCNLDGIAEKFGSRGNDAKNAITEAQAEGFEIDQCYLEGSKPVVKFFMAKETSDGASIKVKTLR